MGERIRCPHCGRPIDRFDQPRLTVDAVVRNEHGEVLLIERGHEPRGWALPGGFVDSGETLEEAVARELAEETGLRSLGVRQFHTYSDPGRDPRHPTVSTVFLVEARGSPEASDDAARAGFFSLDALPSPIAFDHRAILEQLAAFWISGRRPDE